mmetsp:Transcript_39677/g.122678  ORF Transcript_39677/g.122678 Transcript_39677/m.122678 type:complete len:203 (-) Transcript_39677:845-1453(-)
MRYVVRVLETMDLNCSSEHLNSVLMRCAFTATPSTDADCTLQPSTIFAADHAAPTWVLVRLAQMRATSSSWKLRISWRSAMYSSSSTHEWKSSSSSVVTDVPPGLAAFASSFAAGADSCGAFAASAAAASADFAFVGLVRFCVRTTGGSGGGTATATGLAGLTRWRSSTSERILASFLQLSAWAASTSHAGMLPIGSTHMML